MISLLQLPKIVDNRGNLSFLENKNQFPFDIKRVYLIYDVPGGEMRGGHGYKKLEEVIIALSGSFDVHTDNGCGKKRIQHLNRSFEGLYIPGMNWRQLCHFSTNSVALILASRPYEASDYIHDYSEFINLANE